MPDKKLTDTEIVKALEEHYIQTDEGYRDYLMYGGKGDEHEEKYLYMLSDVLDLINHLQKEKEKIFSILAELFDVPCNFSPIDEWLPYLCEYGNECNCEYEKCWEQFFKHYDKKEME